MAAAMALRAEVDMAAMVPPAAGDMVAEGMAAEVALARRRTGRRLGGDKTFNRVEHAEHVEFLHDLHVLHG